MKKQSFLRSLFSKNNDVDNSVTEVDNTTEQENTVESVATGVPHEQETIAKQAEIISAMTVEILDLKAQIENLVAAATAAKKLARLQKVQNAVGTERADGVMQATETLSEEQFNAVISAMASSFDTESKSKMFQESGAALEVDLQAVGETAEMKILREKYGRKENQ